MACSYVVKVEPIGEVLVVERTNCKGISIRVHSDGSVRVAARKGTPVDTIITSLSMNCENIMAAVERCAARNPKKPLLPGLAFAVCGSNVIIDNEAEADKMTCRRRGNAYFVSFPCGRADYADEQFQKFAREAVKRIAIQEAKANLPRRVMAWAEKLGFDVAKVDVRDMKSRWGSCSSAKRICVNASIVLLPEEFADLVILHELTHLHHMNHGPKFHKELDAYISKYIGVSPAKLQRDLKGYACSVEAIIGHLGQ